MKSTITENLNMKDRTTRIIIGIVLAMSPLYMPTSVALFTAAVFASIYPLLTGLTAIDPLLNMISNMKFKSIGFKKKGFPTPYILR